MIHRRHIRRVVLPRASFDGNAGSPSLHFSLLVSSLSLLFIIFSSSLSRASLLY